MENLYNRVENLDEQIRSAKLPYMAWKVLFLVDKESESNKIASILEAEIEEVNSSLALLLENNLITHSTVKSDKATEEEKPIPVKPVIEEPQEKVPEAATATIPDEDEFEVATEPFEQETEEVSSEEQDEEISQDEDIIIEPIEEEQAAEESDDIEIKISEEEDSDAADDMEFNFNLTGDESKESLQAEAKPVVQEEPPKEEKPVQKSTAAGKNILVIDDSLVIRKMVEIALEDEDYVISTAVSGKEGLDALDKINPDLVILDMMLPDINGIEILKTIKASKGIPVIMLSGKDSPQMIESAKNEGAEEFLPKPFKDDDLVAKIKNLI